MAQSARWTATAAALWMATTACQAPTQPAPERDPSARRPSDVTVEPTTAPSPIEPLTAPAPSPFDAAARYSERRGGVAMVVIHGEREVLAAGHNGHSVDAPRSIETATASFWGPVAIAAEIDGLLDLDEPVRFTIGEFDGVHWKHEIRIRQLLDYTSGLESGIGPLDRNEPDDHYRQALRLGAIAAPGTRFQVGPSHLAVFGEVLRRKLVDGLDPVDYLKQRILEPIGVQVSHWRRDGAGNPNLWNGAVLSARQWAKFGVLLRDSGRWRGDSIVSSSDFEACFEPGRIQPRFGLTVWLNPTRADRRAATLLRGSEETFYPDGLGDLRAAAGAGNQRLFAIPSRDLVVARLGEPNRDWRDREFLALVVAAADHLPRGGQTPPAPAN